MKCSGMSFSRKLPVAARFSRVHNLQVSLIDARLSARGRPGSRDGGAHSVAQDPDAGLTAVSTSAAGSRELPLLCVARPSEIRRSARANDDVLATHESDETARWLPLLRHGRNNSRTFSAAASDSALIALCPAALRLPSNSDYCMSLDCGRAFARSSRRRARSIQCDGAAPDTSGQSDILGRFRDDDALARRKRRCSARSAQSRSGRPSRGRHRWKCRRRRAPVA
jgi:hypothetical protein